MYKQTDQLGNVTRYNYDQLAGRLYSVTDAKGNTTKYTYNNDTNQLLSVSSGGMTNYYAYENDRLTFINSNNSVGYKFTYDNFGRIYAEHPEGCSLQLSCPHLPSSRKECGSAHSAFGVVELPS